jgi:hypothetical protein
MNVKQGCLKPALFGCLGITALLVIALVVAGVFAYRGVEQEDVADREIAPAATAEPGAAGDAGADRAADRLPALARKPGRIELDLAHGEFRIRPGEPGTGVRVKARFDQNAHELIDHLEVLPDSTWVYRVEYQRTISGVQAFMRALLGGSQDSRVEVFLPPDAPVALVLDITQGGAEAQLGGLWLSDAVINYSQGGFELDVAEPLREPLDRLEISGSMGGFEANNLGNASPSLLTVDCSMGGAQVDLAGRWLNDADVSLSVSMGGMAVLVPAGLTVEGTPVAGASADLAPADPEVPAPVLRLSVDQSMGEVEVVRK